LQEYLANNPTMKAFTNVADAMAEIDVVLRAHPQRSFRIGTGELADSLALDPLTALSRQLVPFFADRPNALLELKTKTDCVEELLNMDPKGRVVVSWSVNAPQIIAAEEHGTATLEERLGAAQLVQNAGYKVGFTSIRSSSSKAGRKDTRRRSIRSSGPSTHDRLRGSASGASV
jgi:spore photoproduct lyase